MTGAAPARPFSARSVSVGRYFTPTRLRNWFWQGLLIAAVAAIVWYFASNTIDNLTRRNLPIGFGFLWRNAGFDIPFKLVEWSTTDTYGKAVYVALLNTLLVSFLSIVLTTVLGLALGIMRLSPNWLVRNTAFAVIELVKNTPQLVQIFFIYIAVLQTLPQSRNSLHLGEAVFLNIRGLFLPAPIMGETINLVLAVFFAALVAAIVLWRLRKRVAGGTRTALAVVAWGLPVAALVYGHFAGALAGWEYPALKGFNFRGGWAIRPELLALWLGLSIYASAFTAEIVRAAIGGIDRGQTEAAKSLGLSRGKILRLVILPQALRIIIPPLTSQYLNVTKSSSLGAAIAYPEVFLMIGGTTLNQTGQAIEAMAIVMVIFLGINLLTSLFMNWYNRAVALKER